MKIEIPLVSHFLLMYFSFFSLIQQFALLNSRLDLLSMNGVGIPAILVCEFEDASWVSLSIESFVKERNIKYVMVPAFGIDFKIWS